MSYLRVGSVQNLSGSKAKSTEELDKLGVGALQIVQLQRSDTFTFTTMATAFSTTFTPKSTTSKIIISTNISCTNTQTTAWTLYAMRFRIGDSYPFSRYMGSHYEQAYVPMDVTYIADSWGTDPKLIEVQFSPHAGYTHEFNRKVWDPTTGGMSNTSTLRIMEIQTL